MPLALVCFVTELERMKPSAYGYAAGLAPLSLPEPFATERLLPLGLDSATAFLRTVCATFVANFWPSPLAALARAFFAEAAGGAATGAGVGLAAAAFLGGAAGFFSGDLDLAGCFFSGWGFAALGGAAAF